MEKFTETFECREAIDELLARHEKHVKANLDMTDYEVKNQKSRLYKFFCFAWYGHLKKKNNGICLRCGKTI